MAWDATRALLRRSGPRAGGGGRGREGGAGGSLAASPRRSARVPWHGPRYVPRPLRAALPALAGLLLAGCSGADRELSCVLVTLDTTRADALACYGGYEGVSPHLDRLAAEGVLYERAYTVTPLTLPAHASMLTGLYPPRHTVRENGIWPLPEEAATVAEAARAAGVQTAAFLAAGVLDRRFGLAQGFERYDQPERPPVAATTDPAQRDGHAVVGEAVAWLREGRDPDRRFLLWVHLFDPHGPWDAPPRFHGGPWKDDPDGLYLAEVARADDAVGELVAALRTDGLLDDVLVVVVGDHGEGLMDHGEPSHGPFAYDTTLRVPLIVRYPDGWRAGERETGIVSVADVGPTIAEAMGLAVPGGLDGASLHRRGVPDGRGVYFESYAGYVAYGWSPLAGWVDAGGKYVHSSEPQLFDPRLDPGEERDLAGERAAELPRYRDAIARVLDRPALEPVDAPLSPEAAAELRALGYAAVGGSATELPHPLAPTDRPSPQSRMEAHRRAVWALELANRGELERAADLFRSVVRENPRNWFAWDRLGDCLKRLGRHEEAVDALRRVVNDGPAWSYTTFTLAISLMETGRHDEALATFRRALAADPTLDATVRAMLETLRRRGDAALAERYAALLGPGRSDGS